MNENIPAPGLERSAEDRLFAAMPTARSLMAAIEMWDLYAPSHLRGLLRCQVADQPEAPPVARATNSVAAPFVSAPFSSPPSHTGTFAQGLAQFGLAPTKRFQGDAFVVFTYNPNEARDSQGEWTAGGGAADTTPRIRQTVPALEEISTWASRDYRDWARPGTDASGRVHDMTDKYQGWANNLTDDERTAITRYQSGARMYNGYLRHGDKPNKPMEEEMDLSTETDQPFTLDQAVGELQEATMTPAPVDIRAYRGGHVPKKLKSGDIVQDDAFVSTSLAINEASDFVHNAPNSDLIVVDVPKGSPAAYLDANMDAGEQELLLPHGSTFAYMGTIDTKSIETTVEGVALKKYAGQSWLPRKIKRFVYLGPMNKQPSMAHFKHELSDLDEPDDENAGKYEWQEGDLRVIGHTELRASFVFNPEEARDEAGKWTTGGPHVAVADEGGSAPGSAAPDEATGDVEAMKKAHGYISFATPDKPARFVGSVRQAEDWVKGYGVQSVDFGHEPVAASLAASIIPVAVRDVAMSGLPLPVHIWAHPELAATQPGTVAYYDDGSDSLVLATGNEFWKSDEAMRDFARKQAATGWWPTDDPVGLAYHELGHEVASKSGSSIYRYGPNQWRGGKGADVAMQVSRYAATKPHEFVAETFAGLMSGKTYSAPVMVLYKAQGGVIPGAGSGKGVEKLEIADPWAEAMNAVGKRVAAGNAPKYADLTKPRDMLHESMPDTTPDGRKVPALPQKLDDRAQLAGFLHDLGIQGLDFGKGLPDGIGEYAAPILRRMYAQGFPMPRSFNVKPFPPDQLGPGETSEGVVAWYNMADDSLNINSATSAWDKYSGGKASAMQKLKAEAETQHDMGFWSTPDAEHAVVHEMGHLLNKRIMDEVGMDTLNKQLDDAAGKYSRTKLARLVREVSRYSASGVAEFVAETFTGLYSGNKYSKDVMDVYKAAGGPPVTWRDGSPIVDFSARFGLSGPLVRIPMATTAMQVLEV